MTKTVLSVALLVVLTVFTARSGISQSNFYEGKTIRIIVGFSPGGGYDALARMLSRHMPKYIPGHPTILVENMTGAGSLLAANHIFRVAKPDGLTFGHFSGGFAYSQLMGQPGVEFDTQKFVFVGAVARDESANRTHQSERRQQHGKMVPGEIAVEARHHRAGRLRHG